MRPGRALMLLLAPVLVFSMLLTLTLAQPSTAQAGSSSGGVLTMVVDTTGSMGGVINAVKLCITEIVNKVSTISPAPAGYILTDYKDTFDRWITKTTVVDAAAGTVTTTTVTNGGSSTTSSNFTPGSATEAANAYKAAVDVMVASGGGDCPEQGIRAVRTAEDALISFRASHPGTGGATEQVVQFTDADNHAPPGYTNDAAGILQAAKDTYELLRANNTKIFPVLFSGCFTPSPTSPRRGKRHPGAGQDGPRDVVTISTTPDEYRALVGRLAGQINNGSQFFVGGIDESGHVNVCEKLKKFITGGLRTLAHIRGIFGGASPRRVVAAAGTVDIPFAVDGTVTSILASASGDNLASAVLIRPNGSTVLAGDPGVTIDFSSTAAFISVDTPAVGNWIFRLSGTGAFDATVEANSPVGLTTVQFVRNSGGTLVPIAGQPLSGENATLEVILEGPVATVNFALVNESGTVITPITLTQGAAGAPAGAYVGTFVPPDVPFRVLATGTTTAAEPFQRLWDPLFKTQTVAVEITGSAPTTTSPGAVVTFDYTIRNVGPAGTFALSASTNVGSVVISPSTLTLATGETGTARVTLTVPSTVPEGAVITVVFSAGNATTTNTAASSLTVSTVERPLAPSDLHVTDVTQTTVSLAWFDPTPGGINQEDHFEIERLQGGSMGVPVIAGTTPANIVTFIDTGLSPSTTYFYRVRGVNAAGASAWSNQVTATTLAPPVGAPTGVTVVPVTSSSVRVTFQPVPGATGYLVQRECEGDEGFTTVATLTPDVTSVVINGMTPGVACTFRVIALGPGGTQSAPSAAVTVTIPFGGRIRVTPARLVFHVPNGQLQQSQRFTVFNAGFQPLFVSIGQPTASQFAVTGILSPTGARRDVASSEVVNLELSPGERRIVEVRFLPTFRGKTNGRLTITSTDRLNPTVTVNLAGSVPKRRR